MARERSRGRASVKDKELPVLKPVGGSRGGASVKARVVVLMYYRIVGCGSALLMLGILSSYRIVQSGSARHMPGSLMSYRIVRYDSVLFMLGAWCPTG